MCKLWTVWTVWGKFTLPFDTRTEYKREAPSRRYSDARALRTLGLFASSLRSLQSACQEDFDDKNGDGAAREGGLVLLKDVDDPEESHLGHGEAV